MAHDPTAALAFALTRRRRGVAKGREILGGERLGMPLMGVEHQQERWSALDDSYSGMGMAVNAALVALGETEGTFQVEVVQREVEVVTAHEQSRPERFHGAGHVLPDRVEAFAQPRRQRAEPPAAGGARIGPRVKGILDRA